MSKTNKKKSSFSESDKKLNFCGSKNRHNKIDINNELDNFLSEDY